MMMSLTRGCNHVHYQFLWTLIEECIYDDIINSQMQSRALPSLMDTDLEIHL